MSSEPPIDRDAVWHRLRELTDARKSIVPAWVEHKSDAGEVYFYNAETQASVWEKPAELQTAGEIVLAESTWKEYKDPEGRVYFHDATSGKTAWDPPESLLELKALIEEFNASRTDPNSAPVNGAAGRRAVSEDGSVNEESNASSATPTADRISRTSPERGEVLAKESTPAREPTEERQMDVFAIKDINGIDKKEAAEAFRKFLDEKNVPSNINWENCVKIIQSDKRFDVWKKFSDRKQAFNQYKIQKQKQEKEDQRKRQEKAREMFEKMLLATDKISYSTPYRDADRVFATDKVWRGVAERERESLYEDVMIVVEKREKEQAEKDRDESMEKLCDILNNLHEVTYRTTWVECQKYLAECSAFMSDPVVKKINKLDALKVFMDHIIKLEKEHDEEVRNEKRQRKRAHRKHREAYQVLLDELSRQGIISSMAKWKAVFPIIRNDNRFLNMQEQFGSNALDLFKLYVKDLQNRYTTDLDMVLTIIKAQSFAITSKTEFSDFLRVLHKDDRCLALDRGNIKMAFDALRATAMQEDKGREEELRRAQEKEARQKEALEKAFTQMLKDSKMTFAATDKWLSVHDKFAGKSAYQAIRDEEDRIRLFHAYVAKGQTVSSGSSGEKDKSSRKKSKRDKERKEKEKERDKEKDREKERNSDRRKRQASPPAEEESSKGSRSHHRKRPATPSDDEEVADSKSLPKKKKRHHRSPEASRDKERSRRRDEPARRDDKERGSSKRGVDKVVEAKAEKLAQELSEDELENQRKLLMKQLGKILSDEMAKAENADILFFSEIESYIENLALHQLEDIGNLRWFNQHEMLEKLNLQALCEVKMRKEEVVCDRFLFFEKASLLVEILVAQSIWTKKVFPHILTFMRQTSQAFPTYMVLFHTVTAASLLETLTYSESFCQALDDSAMDLIEFCHICIGDQIERKQKGKTINNPSKAPHKTNESVSPIEQLISQKEDIDLILSAKSVGILCHLAQHVSSLNLSVTTRMCDHHDLPVFLVGLLEHSPWTFQQGGRTWKFLDGEWREIPEADRFLLTQTEGQLWIALHQSLLNPDMIKKYYLNDFRKNRLLRVTSLMNEVLLDQLPVLADLQRMAGVYTTDNIDPILPQPAKCACCGHPAKSRCSGCKMEWYCRRECQVKQWSKHKASCAGLSEQL
ncbi:Pre-mRNA-processing factor 40-like protein B [Hypsibius exemplaris]|uniref:Pre-mRNA-processing factor 40-like protein B n=1 Tax=Hypsibius exemplaris TaxID=2072580 RepID=A0A1W0WP12_HYPEX|nr:Pre-mRNA-processing factor 40-like protein B [Hypsibius exemplaris]